MAQLIADCPRCGSKNMTFSVLKDVLVGERRGWQNCYETFCSCRHCFLTATFTLVQRESLPAEILKSGLTSQTTTVNRWVSVEGFIGLNNMVSVQPPDHLPENIEAVFREGATCVAACCHNAAATMFRLCIDLAIRPLLPIEDTPGLNARTRRDLGLRLPWLFDNGKLPEALRELSTCVREDGNDGAHAGTLTKDDADDLLDFTVALLQRMYTEPERLRLAQERRDKRRASSQQSSATD